MRSGECSPGRSGSNGGNWRVDERVASARAVMDEWLPTRPFDQFLRKSGYL
jgi:hypothetical protein